MNKVFRSVWNAATGTWVAAPETARSRGKGNRNVVGALVLGPALLAATTAEAASCLGNVCTGAGPGDSYDINTILGTDYTFKGTMDVLVNGNGQIGNGRILAFENNANLVLERHTAILAGAQITLSDNAELSFNPVGTPAITSTAPAILGGNFIFADSASLNANVTGAIQYGIFRFNDSSSGLSSAADGIVGGTFQLYDNSSFQAEANSVSNAAFNLTGNSVLKIKDASMSNTSVTLAGNSKLRNVDTTEAYNDISVKFASADATLDVGAGMHELTTVTSASLGDGRIHSSWTGGVVQLEIDGDGTSMQHRLSAKLRSDPGNSTVQLKFNGGNWELQGHNDNNGRILLLNTDMHAIGYQKHMTIGTGSRLTGAGQYGQLLIDGGTFSPGLGTVQADHLALTSTYEVSARDSSAAGSSSRIETDTMALADSARIHVLAESGSWNSQRQYEIIRVNDGFWIDPLTPELVTSIDPANVTANFAYLTPTVTTVPDDENDPDGPASVVLTLQRNSSAGQPQSPVSPSQPSHPGDASAPANPGTPMTFASLAETANQRGVANAVESLPSSHEVYNFVETLPVGAPPAVFNSLSGEAHASLLSILPNLTSHAYRLPLANLRHSLNAGLNPAAATAQVGGTQGSSGLPAFDNKPAWVELVGNWQDIDGDANAASLDQHSAGIFVGYDNEVADGWYLGGALGYTKTDADIGHRDSEADIHSYSATLYGGKAFALDTQRQLNLLAGLSYTYHDIDSERKIRGLGQKLEADYGAHTAQLFGEAGYLVGQPYGRFVEPFAGLTVSYLEADAVQEKGGSAALHGDSENETLVTSSLGVRAQPPYELGNFGAVLRGSLAWEHAFGDERFDRTMSFADGSQDFRVRGVSMDRDTAVLGFGTQVNLSATAALSLDYEGRFASGMRDHGASLKAQWNF